MAASPPYKIYDSQNRYQAACHELEAAACLVAFYGDGATIRSGHTNVIWREGSELISAGDSYDQAAAILISRTA